MKKYFFIIFVVSLSILSTATAEQWACTADINKGSVIKMNAIVNVGIEANLSTYYKNEWADDKVQVAQRRLVFVESESYQDVIGDSCNDQYYGIQEHYLNFSDKTKTAAYTYSWCDDDGGSGFESYNLICEQIK
ncbi:MAG: hypothetical protein ABL930_00180 [Pseudobdellovibrio sp.]